MTFALSNDSLIRRKRISAYQRLQCYRFSPSFGFAAAPLLLTEVKALPWRCAEAASGPTQLMIWLAEVAQVSSSSSLPLSIPRRCFLATTSRTTMTYVCVGDCVADHSIIVALLRFRSRRRVSLQCPLDAPASFCCCRRHHQRTSLQIFMSSLS